MNSFFMGSPVSMAERYASLLKTMFVCLFFSAIFPQGYFVASMAMFMTYWVSSRGSRLYFVVRFCPHRSFLVFIQSALQLWVCLPPPLLWSGVSFPSFLGVAAKCSHLTAAVCGLRPRCRGRRIINHAQLDWQNQMPTPIVLFRTSSTYVLPLSLMSLVVCVVYFVYLFV